MMAEALRASGPSRLLRRILHGRGFWPAAPALAYLIVFMVLPIGTLLLFGFVTIERGRIVGDSFTSVHLDKALIAIPPKEAKGRKKWRVIRLEGRALEIVRNRLPGTTGKLFANRDGAAWTSSSVNCRFCRLKGERCRTFSFTCQAV